MEKHHARAPGNLGKAPCAMACKAGTGCQVPFETEREWNEKKGEGVFVERVWSELWSDQSARSQIRKKMPMDPPKQINI